MLTLTATTPCDSPPAWAFLERALIDMMNRAIDPFLERYVIQGGERDGELIWREGGTGSRDGADDFYESAYNWPLLYLLGGDERLLHHGQRLWDGITRQLTRAGMVHREYELGYDQFHQGESYIYFYFLCLADPDNEINRERAERFAKFYTGDDPDAPNYDAEHQIIRAAHNGSGGPRWGYGNSDQPAYRWAAGMRPYGLPFEDIPGINHYDDLKEPALARRMGQAMHERMGQGDVAGNLIVTSLVTNAYLLTGDERYRSWVLEYVDAWRERARANGDLLPDNVGLSGEVGEHMDGKWYGGLYGWSWPHGFYNIEMAALVAGANALLINRDDAYLELPRRQMERILSLGKVCRADEVEMSLRHHWADQIDETEPMFLVPYRYADSGWFDWQPPSPVFATALWHLSQSEEDWQRLEMLRERSPYDWRRVTPFHNKADDGHEQPWLRFLAGDNPDYPAQILSATYGQLCRRLALIEADDADLMQLHIHHWQWHNPVSTEALLQLTLGAPQIIYNGGLLHCQVRYFDAIAERPGLPPDVAALVERIDGGGITLRLVNLSPFGNRDVIVQAGAFGEHRFTTAQYEACSSDYPGVAKEYSAPPLETETERVDVEDKHLRVHLPPASEITLELGMARHVNQPSYEGPRFVEEVG